MTEPAARVWKKIALFYGLTLLFSNVFNAFELHAGKMDAGNLLYVTGAMWSPALAAFATKRMFGERARDLPWKWGDARYPWLGYLIPILYTVPVYAIAWMSGLGAFNTASLTKTAESFGWQNFPTGVALVLFVVLTASVGMVARTYPIAFGYLRIYARTSASLARSGGATAMPAKVCCCHHA